MEHVVEEIEIGQVEAGAPVRATIETVRGALHMVGRPLSTPFGSMAIEDFGAGEEVRWAFWHAESHYIVSGRAEVEYTLPPWHDTVKNMEVGPGSFYIIPPGADMRFRVSADEPLRKLCVIMPLQEEYGEVRPASVTRPPESPRRQEQEAT